MLEKSVNFIIGVLNRIKGQRVGSCFNELKKRPIGINLWERTMGLKILSRNIDKLDKNYVAMDVINKELMYKIE